MDAIRVLTVGADPAAVTVASKEIAEHAGRAAKHPQRDVSQAPTDVMPAIRFHRTLAVGNGVEIRKLDAMVNHNTTEVFIDNLKLPPDALIGEAGKGFRYIIDGMNAERILIAYECLGDAKYFLRRGTDYANERVVFGRPIGQNQGIQFPLARAHAELCAAELMVRKAAALFETKRDCGPESNIGKLLAADASWHAGEACMQTFGGFAFAREYGIERKWRECRLYQTAPISSNMILAYIGQHVLGLPRSY